MQRSKRHRARAAAGRRRPARAVPDWIEAIRSRREAILAAWSHDERFVRVVDSSTWLEEIIGRAIEMGDGGGSSRPVPAFSHTIEAELEVGQIVGHYAALRDAIANEIDRDLPPGSRIGALLAVGRAIDEAVAA